jgi:electron transfer flavoprotein beta subunit
MNIVICIKQVPNTLEVSLNKETHTIIREGVESVINAYDMYALEEGLRIKEKLGGKVTVISMGIPSVSEALRQTIALGADDAVLLSDKVFAGSDSLATAYALSLGIQSLGGYDLIICGKQSSDGDTGQVGPSLAERLDMPHMTNVRKIREISDKHVIVERATDDGYDVVMLKLPSLLTVVKEINEPRLSSLKGKMMAKKAAIKLITAQDLGADKALCGLSGSPTVVEKTFVPVHSSSLEILEGTPAEQAVKLADKLSGLKLMGGKIVGTVMYII